MEWDSRLRAGRGHVAGAKRVLDGEVCERVTERCVCRSLALAGSASLV